MIHSWFFGDTLVLVAGCFALSAALGLLAYRLVFASRLFAPVRGRPSEGAFLGSTAGLFALLLAFNAGHAWTNESGARRAASAEAEAAERILHVAGRFHSDPGAALAPLRAYLAAVVEEEWRGAHNAEAAPAAVAALRALEDMVWQARADRRLEPALADAMMRALDALEAARAARLSLAAQVGDGARWLAMFALGFAALLGMGMSHANRPETARVAMGVFALAMAIASSVTAAYESPYSGAFSIGPEALAAVLAEMPGR